MLIYCREIVNLYGPASFALRRLRRSAVLVGRLSRLSLSLSRCLLCRRRCARQRDSQREINLPKATARILFYPRRGFRPFRGQSWKIHRAPLRLLFYQVADGRTARGGVHFRATKYLPLPLAGQLSGGSLM